MGMDEVRLIQPKVHRDRRGYFLESFRQSDFELEFVQDNHSYSKKGVLRGMHFQKGQAKLVRVVSGQVFDVVVDMRAESATFGEWRGFYLDGESHEMLYVPDGYAHGFYAMSDVHLAYKVSAEYNPELESGFRYNDPDVGIEWPMGSPQLSERDRALDYWKKRNAGSGVLSPA